MSFFYTTKFSYFTNNDCSLISQLLIRVIREIRGCYLFLDVFEYLVERFLGEFHHLVAFCPRVQTAVHDRRGDDIRPVSQSRTEVIEPFVAIERAHAFAHQFLLRIGCAELIELLTPQVDLVAQVHLRRAERLTTVAECAGTDVA